MAEKKGKKRYQGSLDEHDKSMQDIPCAFYVNHYAADVLYDVRGWTDKDQDKLTSLMYDMLATSTNPGGFMVEEFAKLNEKGAGNSVCGVFAGRLDALTETLGHTKTNFVRCIKASNPLAAGVYSAGLVLNQLRYTGMLQTLQIRRLGFPFRPSHLAFWDKYHVLDTSSKISNFDDEADVKAAAVKLCDTISAMAPGIADDVLKRTGKPVDPEQIKDCIRVGESKRRKGGEKEIENQILVRDWLSRELDARKTMVLDNAAVFIQAAYRGAEFKKEYSVIQKAYTGLRNPMRQFTTKSAVFKENDIAGMSEDKQWMDGYMKDQAAEMEAEHEERVEMGVEEDYRFRVLDVTALERYAAAKKEETDTADRNVEAARRRFAAATSIVQEEKEAMDALDEAVAAKLAGITQDESKRKVDIVALDRKSNNTRDEGRTMPSRAKFRVTFKRR